MESREAVGGRFRRTERSGRDPCEDPAWLWRNGRAAEVGRSLRSSTSWPGETIAVTRSESDAGEMQSQNRGR